MADFITKVLRCEKKVEQITSELLLSENFLNQLFSIQNKKEEEEKEKETKLVSIESNNKPIYWLFSLKIEDLTFLDNLLSSYRNKKHPNVYDIPECIFQTQYNKYYDKEYKEWNWSKDLSSKTIKSILKKGKIHMNGKKIDLENEIQLVTLVCLIHEDTTYNIKQKVYIRKRKDNLIERTKLPIEITKGNKG